MSANMKMEEASLLNTLFSMQYNFLDMNVVLFLMAFAFLEYPVNVWI